MHNIKTDCQGKTTRGHKQKTRRRMATTQKEYTTEKGWTTKNHHAKARSKGASIPGVLHFSTQRAFILEDLNVLLTTWNEPSAQWKEMEEIEATKKECLIRVEEQPATAFPKFQSGPILLSHEWFRIILEKYL